MRSGVPLDDADRWPWLDRLADAVDKVPDAETVVCARSALKRSYRDRLRLAVHRPARFVRLEAPRSLLEERLERRSGHYMPASSLSSQLETLELPQNEADSIIMSAADSPEQLLRGVLDRLKLGAPRPRRPRR